MPGAKVHMRPIVGREDWIRKALQSRVDVGVIAAKRLAPKDTGALAASISGRVTHGRGGLIGVIEASAEYALFVHNGTGLYGPRRALIFPRKARAMRWVTKEGDVVFARWTRGQRPQPFLADALIVAANPNLQAVSGYTRPSGRRVQSYIRRRPGA